MPDIHACVLAMQRGSRATPRAPGTGVQRARMAAILYFEEEDQFYELELALEKASGSYQEELKRSSAPVLPRPVRVNFAGAIMNVRELLIPSVSLHRRNNTKRRQLFCVVHVLTIKRPRAIRDCLEWPIMPLPSVWIVYISDLGLSQV